MIYSMTAFARSQSQGTTGNLTCEMRSINHRYLEMNLYLPELLRGLEMSMRDYIRKFIKRGKLECVIRYQPNPETETAWMLNQSLTKALCQASEQIAQLLQQPGLIQPTEILRFSGVFEAKPVDASNLQTEVFPLLEKTLHDLVAARAREGEELKQLFLQRIDLLQLQLQLVKQRLPQVLNDQLERLRNRFLEAKLEIDHGRLEQEMLLFVQKIDIAEELDRIETHIAEVRRVLEQNDAAGRRLDFLLQELNREANTLGAKSVDATIMHAAVEMKVLIEQVREQVQNIE